MNVFVVVTGGMGGSDPTEVCVSMEVAKVYAKGKPYFLRIMECSIIGEQEQQDVVYTASIYDSRLDIHHFEGIYGSFEQAKSVSGEHGLSLNKKILQE